MPVLTGDHQVSLSTLGLADTKQEAPDAVGLQCGSAAGKGQEAEFHPSHVANTKL